MFLIEWGAVCGGWHNKATQALWHLRHKIGAIHLVQKIASATFINPAMFSAGQLVREGCCTKGLYRRERKKRKLRLSALDLAMQ